MIPSRKEDVIKLALPKCISLLEIKIVEILIGSAALQLVECTEPVHIQVPVDIVTNMMMTVMKADMEAGMKIEMDMAMGEKENTAIGMMIDMVDMETHMVVMEIVMAEIMRNATAKMGIGMMIIGEEVKALMVMVQEAGVQIETVVLKMMVTPHLGTGYFLYLSLLWLFKFTIKTEAP